MPRAQLAPLVASVVATAIAFVTMSDPTTAVPTPERVRVHLRGHDPRAYANVTHAEEYVATLGWPAGLPTVHVAYGEVQVEGADSRFNSSRDKWLAYPPVVYWHREQLVCKEPCMYVILSPDSNQAPSAPGATSAAALHGMWSDCVMGTQPSCKELAPYRPPQPSEEPHRYIFLLYEQTGSVDAATAGTAEWQNWDAEGFLAANPSLEPAAINFFYSV